MRNHNMTIEARLIEYAEWLNDPALNCAVGWSVFGRIQEDQENAGLHGDGFKPEIIDGVPCRPDGGVGALAERLGRDIARDNRCRDIHDLIQYLPAHHREVMAAAFVGERREVPRSVRSAADRLGIKRSEFCERKAALLAWFEGAMYRTLAFAA